MACELLGPPHPSHPDRGPLKLPFTITVQTSNRATLRINGGKHALRQGEYTDWIRVRFRAGFGLTIQGVCRFLLQATEPDVELYVTPVNIDPERTGHAHRLSGGLPDLPGQATGTVRYAGTGGRHLGVE